LWPISISGSVSGTQLGGVSTTAVTTLETSIRTAAPQASNGHLQPPMRRICGRIPRSFFAAP
jgi:hypothetical protein